VKSLVVYYSPAALKFKNVSEWMVRMYERRELWSLLEPNSAKSLIACSNSITEDQYELKMTNILSNSRICFVYNDNDQEYQIECVYGMKEVNIVEPSELLKAIKEKSTKFSYYHFNEILDIKLKLIIFLRRRLIAKRWMLNRLLNSILIKEE
jgi:hypothetical protein